jgi:WD40 repeat protein
LFLSMEPASLSLTFTFTFTFTDGWHLWIGERKEFEVYSCDVSPDGKRLVTAAGGQWSSVQISSSDTLTTTNWIS